MKNLYSLQSWIFKDYGEVVRTLGSYKDCISEKIIDYYEKCGNKYELKNLRGAIWQFLHTHDQIFARKHLTSAMELLVNDIENS